MSSFLEISGLRLSTYLILAMAMCATWLPRRLYGTPIWMYPYVLSLVLALVASTISPIALIVLLALAVINTSNAPQFNNVSLSSKSAWSPLFEAVTIAGSIALMLHDVPGFNNAPVLKGVLVSMDGVPFNQYLNFDKGAAGLGLLAAYGIRASNLSDLRVISRKATLLLGPMMIAVFGLACILDAVHWDPKFPSYAGKFLLTNFFFAVIPEEALFRGWLQRRLIERLRHLRGGKWYAVAFSGILFGLAHLPGGICFAAMAGVAGVFYALAYSTTNRIEAPILLHFSLNAVHFFAFTYPSLPKP